MGERTAEDEVTAIPDQLEKEKQSSREGEGEEKVHAEEEDNGAACLDLNPDEMQENNKERVKGEVPASKNKPGRMQSVYSLVRDQIRAQPSREASRTGMLQLVQQVTRQLDKTRVEEGGLEDTSLRKEVQETLEVQQETPVDLKDEPTTDESKKDESVVLLRKILNNIEALRKEVGEELHLLRQESRSNTDKMLRELEAQFTHSLKTDANTNAPVSVPPPPGAPRRRILRRTLTTVVPKISTAQAIRPRCMSEPVGGVNAKIASTGCTALSMSRMKPLPPSLVFTQQAKKPVRSKSRINKPAS